MNFYFKTLIRFLQFIFFPVGIPQKVGIQDDREWIQIDFKGQGLPLIISFAGLGDQFNFRKTLDGYKVNIIYLRDLSHNWYLNGIPEVGNTVHEIEVFLKNRIQEFKPSKVIMIGVSAGGFASILYGDLVKADNVLAFSPQTFMNRLNCICFIDYRWLDRVVQIYKGDRSNRVYLDLKRLVAKSDTTITLVYDRTHRLDNLHAKRIKGNKVRHEIMVGGGHQVAQDLKDSGLLKTLIEAILMGDPRRNK